MLLRIHIVIISLLACPVTEHLLVCFRFLKICIAKPGQTGQKLQVLAACPISDLRKKVTEKYNVEPECQLLVYKGQVLVDEHPGSKASMKVEDYIAEGDRTSTYFIKEETIQVCLTLDNVVWRLNSGTQILDHKPPQ